MSYLPLVFIGPTITTDYCGETAMEKKAVVDSIELTNLGLMGDEQADKRVHGGPDRALCHYPREHYELWQTQYPELKSLFRASAFGENISTIGMTEENVHIGDVYQWGTAIIQVTQPRSPCFKLNGLTQLSDFSCTMQESGKIGWLYRVIKAGTVSENEPLILLNRGAISIAETIAIAFHQDYNDANTKRLLSAAGLSASWTATMVKRLQTEEIESFNNRLFGRR
ncbi:MAG: 6-hydroxyaminopurine reductase [Wohlfahrtiimonas sp.]